MKRLRPWHALLLILAFSGLVIGGDILLEGGKRNYETVKPDPQGQVILDVGDFEINEVRFYRFINAGNQEIFFLVGRDESSTMQVGFDSSENHYKLRRGFSSQGGWIVDNKCDTTSKLAEVNESRGNCRPVPVKHQVLGDRLILTESNLLKGWRYFR